MLIKNAYLIDPASKTSQKADLRIEGGCISRIAAEITPDVSEEVIDASGLVAAPGLIDTHVHFRDPGFTYKETLHTGALTMSELFWISAAAPKTKRSASTRRLLSPAR